VRIGLKVSSIGAKGGWETYVNTTPVPGAALLGLIGLSAAGLKLRRCV
jgi:hypothetical protein